MADAPKTAGMAAENGPKYFVNIDGKDYAWSDSTITAAQLRELAGWISDQSIEEVNLKTGEKKLLRDSEAIQIKPGHGFSKQIEFVEAGPVTPPKSWSA